jgi:catechol 2,3-dioxygenase-like lactoylglutathione lyase family enzyme
MMIPLLNAIVIYAKDMQRSAAFYQRYFGFTSTGEVREGLIELVAPTGPNGSSNNGGGNGVRILIHQAGKGVKLGQAGVKLTFSVPDVEAFKTAAAELGLTFGSTHQANGYTYANAKDPDGNALSISSRAFRSVNSVEA